MITLPCNYRAVITMNTKKSVMDELEDCKPQESIPESRAEEMVKAFGVNPDSVDLTRGYDQGIEALDVMEAILDYHEVDPVGSADVGGEDALEEAKEKNLDRIKNHFSL